MILVQSELSVTTMKCSLDSSSAVATVAETLAKNHINISYAYCTAGAKGGRTTGVLKVANVPKAMKALQKKHKKTSKKQNPLDD